MGGDGGSIPKRCEQIKVKPKVLRESDPDKVRSDLATRCAINHHPLAKPVVVCDLGNLYSKTSVCNFLLERKNECHTFKHLKSIKHVYDSSANFLDEDKARDESTATPIICPVTNVTFIGSRPFVLMRHCRCVLSQKAIERLGGKGRCVACESPIPAEGTAPYDSLFPDGDEFRDFIPLLPKEQEKDRLRQRLFAIREHEHKQRLKKKEEKKAAKAATSAAKLAAMPPPPALPERPLTAEEEKQKRKDERKAEKKRKRAEEKKDARAKQSKMPKEDVDERAAQDPRYKSKVFASMFLKPGQDDARNRKEFMSGISTKPLSHMSYL